jgi:hypothetical protein
MTSQATSPYLNHQPRTYLEARAAKLATKLAAERAARQQESTNA